jgi:hypothetical protein
MQEWGTRVVEHFWLPGQPIQLKSILNYGMSRVFPYALQDLLAREDQYTMYAEGEPSKNRLPLAKRSSRWNVPPKPGLRKSSSGAAGEEMA